MSFREGLEGIESLRAAAASERTQVEKSSRCLELETNTVHLLARNGQTVRVVSGLAWITFRGDTKDYFVEQGEEMIISRGRGTAQISALYQPLVFEIQ